MKENTETLLFKGISFLTEDWVSGRNVQAFHLEGEETESQTIWNYCIHPTGSTLELTRSSESGMPQLSFRPFLVHPESLCQYTGLDDEDGIKLFSGDLISVIDYTLGIHHTDSKGNKAPVKFEIKYSNGMYIADCGISNYPLSVLHKVCKYCGNISDRFLGKDK